jgi:hypothetical protein
MNFLRGAACYTTKDQIKSTKLGNYKILTYSLISGNRMLTAKMEGPVHSSRKHDRPSKA